MIDETELIRLEEVALRPKSPTAAQIGMLQLITEVRRLKELINRVTNEVNLWDNQPLLYDLMDEGKK
jgi:hypothetical protein